VLLGMGDMGMDHGAHAGHAAPATDGAVDHSQMDHSKMDHAAMGHTMPAAAATAAAAAVRHAPAESGPIVDMRVSQVKTGLDDPGVGLRDNGRRVLTYADLGTLGGAIDARDAAREIELHLTGHMERYIWSFNGQKFSDAVPLQFRHGERLRLTLVNDTMMTHPIHLHGMWSEVVDPTGAFRVRKHTVVVNPAQRISYLVTADALGRWAYHCHLLYHMEAGMFREVVVA
jgi:CopA family copper-resistance protein